MIDTPFPTVTEVAEFQAAAESGMVDTCTISRQTGTTTDPNTGAEAPTWGAPLYSGKCRVRSGSGGGSNLGQQPIVTTGFTLHVPFSVAGIQVNDVATIDSSLDPDLTGRTLRINSPWGQTFASARRFSCEESTIP